jgi:hypothetical protein
MLHHDEKTLKKTGDARIAVYRFVKYIVLVSLCAVFVKTVLLDTIVIDTDQMAPTLLAGDRALVFRAPVVRPMFGLPAVARGMPVVAMHPLLQKKLACLRVAAVGGDSIFIGGGVLQIVNCPGRFFGGAVRPADVLLPEFAPRDSMKAYRLPRKGDAINLDSLPLRDFFFAAAMIRQERPRAAFEIKTVLTIDGKNADDIPMTNFSLFKGTVAAVPEKYQWDWFFWDRLRSYWTRAETGKKVALSFELYDNTGRLSKFVFRESFIFLIADDWEKGYDSRYFGPVAASSVKGSIVSVLWSITPHEGLFGPLRTDRIIKIVK